MTWLLTATGHSVDLRCIGVDDVRIEDIAHHLAQTNRYTGACKRPYSVAEHSLLVAELIERRQAIPSPSVLMAGLMHDAHEAYTQDLSAPMKQVIGAAWQNEERRIQRAVLKAFGLITPWAAARELIHWADMTALSTERVALLPPTGPEWPCVISFPPVDWVDFDSRAAFTWEDWRQAFLDRFAELQHARELQVADIPIAPTSAQPGDPQ